MTPRNYVHDGMVHYHQLRSACGLASALMILQPRKNVETLRVLDLASANLEVLCHGMKRLLGPENTRHQLCSAYILLKMIISDSIGSMLVNYNKRIYEEIQAVILHEMRMRLSMKYQKSTVMDTILDDYMDSGTLPCKLVEAYATVMKSNVELKLLLAAFGFQPVPFPGSIDGTGALVFRLYGQNIRMRTDSTRDSTSKSVQNNAGYFMISNFDECGILSWQGFHWSVVKSITESDGHVDAIYCLDPGSPTSRELRLDTRDPATCLYFFKKNITLLEKMLPLVENLLETAEDEKQEPDSIEISSKNENE